MQEQRQADIQYLLSTIDLSVFPMFKFFYVFSRYWWISPLVLWNSKKLFTSISILGKELLGVCGSQHEGPSIYKQFWTWLLPASIWCFAVHYHLNARTTTPRCQLLHQVHSHTATTSSLQKFFGHTGASLHRHFHITDNSCCPQTSSPTTSFLR